MRRTFVITAIAFLVAILPVPVPARAQPKPDGPKKDDIYVIVTARLYDVDDALYKKLAKEKLLTKADLENLERLLLKGPARPASADAPLTRLEKQKPQLAPRPINIAPGKEAAILSTSKAITCLPTPDQLRQGKKTPQTFHEGFSLSARVEISGDRRYVQIKFTEKSLEIEGFEKLNVVVDEKGTEAFGEIAFLKELSASQTRDIPDGGTFLLPLQYRPRGAREGDRWLVAHIVVRIYIEEEERLIRGGK